MVSGRMSIFFLVVYICCSLAAGKSVAIRTQVVTGTEIDTGSSDSFTAEATTSTNSTKKVGVPPTTESRPSPSRVMQAPGATRSTNDQPPMTAESESEPEDRTLNVVASTFLSFVFGILIYSTIKYKFCPSTFARQRDQAIKEEEEKATKRKLVKELRAEARSNPIPPYAGTSIILLNTPDSSDQPLFTEEFYSPYSQYAIPEKHEEESNLCANNEAE